MSDVVTIKLMLMGDSGTGKSSILIRFCDDKFYTDEAATIGILFPRIIIIVAIDVFRQSIFLQVLTINTSIWTALLGMNELS